MEAAVWLSPADVLLVSVQCNCINQIPLFIVYILKEITKIKSKASFDELERLSSVTQHRGSSIFGALKRPSEAQQKPSPGLCLPAHFDHFTPD
jgi:hypothetical protein